MLSTLKKRNSLTMISCAVLLMTGLSACNKSQTNEKLMADAKQYQQKGDNKAAVIQLKNVLQQDPENKEARYLLGTIYNLARDPVSAEKELRKAISLGLSPATALPDLAQSLLAQRQFQKMLDETAVDPRAKTEANFASLRGNAFLGLGKSLEAKESFELALKASPDFPDALIGMAMLAVAGRDMAVANKLTDQATSKNPKHVQAWMFKGDLLQAQGKTDDALAAYDQAAQADPSNSAALLVKAQLEIGMKKFAEAKKDIDAAKKLSAYPVLTFYTQGLLDYSQQKFPEALESMQQVEKMGPDYMPGVLLSGAVQHALGATAQAEQHLKKYIESNPNNAYANKLMASILLKSAQPARAIALLEPLLKAESDDSRLYALAGEAHMQTKNFTKATEYFEKASALAPKAAEYRTALGMSSLGQGDSGRAIIELEKAADLDVKSAQAGILLIMTHVRLKEFDKALAAAKTTAKDHPDNPVIKNLEGGIFLNKNDAQNARSSFEKAVSLQPTYFAAVANLARLDMQEKKPEAAKKRLELLLEKDTKNLQAMTALAGLAVANGNNEEAKTWLERANAADASSLDVTQLLALHYGRMGDKQKALSLAGKAQTNNPKTPGFMELLGQIQMNFGDKQAALDSYSKHAAMVPDSASAQFKLAAAYVTTGNDSAAIDALKKVLRIDGKSLDAQVVLSSLLTKKGSFDEALAISRQIQKQDGKSPLGYVQEGDIYLAQKKSALAMQAYEKAFKIGKNGQLVTKIHRALILDGKLKDADARLVQWLKEHPEDNSARTYFAMHNLATPKTKQLGIEQLQIVLKSDANNVMVLNNLAWAYYEEKDARALDLAEKAYKLAGKNPAIMDTLGWILVEQGNVTRGLPLIQDASAQTPETLDIRYHLAVGLMKSGDKVKAKKEFEYILATGKEFAKKEDVKAFLKQL